MTGILRASTVNSTDPGFSVNDPCCMGALISCSCPKAEKTPALKTRTVMEDFCGSIAPPAGASAAQSTDDRQITSTSSDNSVINEIFMIAPYSSDAGAL